MINLCYYKSSVPLIRYQKEMLIYHRWCGRTCEFRKCLLLSNIHLYE